MRDSKKKRDIHYEAIQCFDRIQTAVRDERYQALEDRRFYSIAGAQWEGSLGEQFERRPKFEINKSHLSVIKIINEYRNNRVTVNFISKDGRPDDLAETCNGLFRADEQDSSAEEAYDNGFEEAVGGGFGAWRLTTAYEDEEDEEDERQRIRLEPIYDADASVFFDLDAKKQDKSDAKYCFVIYSMTPEDFEDEWGKSPAPVDKQITNVEYDWYTPDMVYVAEYYRVEMVKTAVHKYMTLTEEEERYTDEDFEDDPELERRLEAVGTRKVGEKKVQKRKIHKYIISGNEILEDCGYIAGKHIPIIPVYGKRWFVDNIERFMGHVRLVKDAQRLKNMQMSKLAEISASSTIEKPIFLPEQISGHEVPWAEDNIKNYPYMTINPVTDANGNPSPVGPVAYTKPPQVPPALGALMQIVDIDIRELLGGSGGEEKMLSHVSGKAHELIQKRIDGQAFIYLSNFAKAIRRTGEVWLSMARDVYVEKGRKMKTVNTMGKTGTVELMTPGYGPDGGLTEKNDITRATFDVAVDVGPSSASQREATVQTLIGMLSITQDPQTQQVLQAMAMMNMEGDGISETREYFRKQLVQMGVLQPTEEEAEAMAKAASEPSPQDKALLAMAAESEAKAMKAQAEVQETMSDVELNKAKTAETYAKVDRENLQAVSDMLARNQEQLQREQEARQKALLEQQKIAAQRSPQIPNAT